MPISQIEPNNLKDIFVNSIIEDILSGKLEIGEKLPAERVIAENICISRNVVRVGLSQLAALGFLTVEQRQGAYVNDYVMDGNILTFDAITRTHAKLTPALLRNLLDFRMLVLCESAKLAAGRRNEKNLEDFKIIIAEQAKLKNDNNIKFTQLDFEFHKNIYVASDNAVYTMIHNSIRALHKMLAAEFYIALETKTAIKECHQQIYAAIKLQNPEAAERWTKAALDLGNEVMVNLAYLSK